MPKISMRGIDMPASPIRKLAPYAIEAQARGIKILSLNIGQPDLPTPPSALKALHNIDRKVLEYSPSDGLPSLRAKMAEYYGRFGIEVAPGQIIITCGGSEAVLLAFLSTLNPGDEVIIPEPAYANYVSFSKIAGAKIIGLPTRIEDGFALPSIEEIEKLITPNTKAIMICNPNNPTGYVYSNEEMMKLATIVKKHDLFLFSDEVYREFCYKGHPAISALQLEGVEEQVVVIDSVSKRYNECGIRVGNIVTRNKELRDVIMKFCQARLSPPLLGQIVAEASIDTEPEYLNAAFEEYRQRRDFLLRGLNEIPGVYSPMPEGAFYTVARLPIDSSEKFCRWCLEEFSYNGSTVFMAPAAGFYTIPGMGLDEVRIAYVLKREDLEEALVVLRKALEAYPGRKK
ncbi:MAG: pyridoxal phosphate-dependent aminotransferase [Clostridium sp.]|nr:pyridoxal phosphate-dependent aminotransferase [Prevotella sp.]MCM1429250.1 pyridoxal phosphate-dependent aminotransferase [Clostridium sp.]MCM1475717.1 pyridoxal phosphate-dependent aminotransferase [Muribaculaceae bacterium]